MRDGKLKPTEREKEGGEKGKEKELSMDTG